MNYILLGAALALTWFLLVNVGASLVVAAATPAALGLSRRWRPHARRRFLLAVRLAPTTAAALYALAGFLPAYWRFEPRHAVEPVAIGLALGALGSAALAAYAAARLLRSHHRTAAVVRRWMQTAEPMTLAGLNVRAFRIRERIPVVSLIGVTRPRLVVADAVPRVLTAAELRAVLAHEMAHRAQGDNFWRLLLTACPDVLALMPAAGRLTRAWVAAAEESADDRAAAGDADRAAVLASAIVKLAGLVPSMRPLHAAGSMLFEDRPICERVTRLLQPPRPGRRVPVWALATACMLAGGVAVSVPSIEVARTIHAVSERLVAFLS